MTRKTKLLIVLATVAACVALFGGWANYTIALYGEGRIHSNVEDVEVCDVAMVLGTAKFAPKRGLNQFYMPRIRAAAELYHAGKVRGIVVSGDNSSMRYNEPRRMKQDLVSLGVPEEHITSDYAGLRTLDSVVRMKKVFGVEKYIIVSQKFQIRRALYIADAEGHDATGFAADDVTDGYGSRVRLREFFARIKAVTDVHLLGRNPKYLGKHEKVKLKPVADM